MRSFQFYRQSSYILHIPKSARPLGHHRIPHIQPAPSILHCPRPLSRPHPVPGLSIIGCCPPISLFVCLLLSVPALFLVGLSWQAILALLLYMSIPLQFFFSLRSGGHQKTRWIVVFDFLLPHWWCGLCTRCRGVCESISSLWPVSSFLGVLLRSTIRKHLGIWRRARSASVWFWTLVWCSCHSKLSLTLSVLFFVCAILAITPGFAPWSVIIDPRYLKLCTASSFSPLTLMSELMLLVLLVINLVFWALISMSYVAEVLSRHSTSLVNSLSVPARPSMSTAKRRLVIVLPPKQTVPSWSSSGHNSLKEDVNSDI